LGWAALALNNFTVPVILVAKVYLAEVRLRFSTHFDTPGALGVSWPLVLEPGRLLLVPGHPPPAARARHFSPAPPETGGSSRPASPASAGAC